ncbi:hypothetical protein ACERK3_09690 [Phycisphaerales bacterium AB-hyl4]|uniref:HNH endonuclease n=1 Tax=Natronomicrosphaera hydrolytica TaxID=3242702 RepID=A0ABV4U5G3_9BACT
MIVNTGTNHKPLPPGWEYCELRGGPANRQLVELHRLHTEHVVHVGTVAHRYLRVGRDSVLWHESVIAGAFNGSGKVMR